MNLIEKTKNNKLYYEIKDFNIDNHMKHLFSSRVGWDQSRLLEDLSKLWNIPLEKIYSGRQVHGTDIKLIKDEDPKFLPMEKYDGLVTNRKNVVLCTYHADCVPIYFYDKNKQVIGLAHGGWKGTLHNICKTMILKMDENYGSKLKDILVSIGPSIGPCCYEVKKDVSTLFEEVFLDKNIITKRENKLYLNLWRANRENLLNIGIKEKNIIFSDFCTSCNSDTLYSYRKEKGTKNRMIGAMVLKG